MSLDVRKSICVLSETAKSTCPPAPQVKLTLVTVRKLSTFICESHENHNVSTRAFEVRHNDRTAGKPSGQALEK